MLTGNCRCQMLLHYLKLHTVSQYRLLSTAGMHSLITELYKEQSYKFLNESQLPLPQGFVTNGFGT